VSSVAYAPRIPRATTASTDNTSIADDAASNVAAEAPMADLAAAIGPGTSLESLSNLFEKASDWMAWLFALLALGLIGEVASRQLRGAS
jgi:hypothetical protein